VRMWWRDDQVRLEVYDDGHGPLGKGPLGQPGGYGLTGMRERVAAAGGELSLGAGPDGVGYRVAASLPLTPH
jgi:signal transduction histidine kinase